MWGSAGVEVLGCGGPQVCGSSGVEVLRCGGPQVWEFSGVGVSQCGVPHITFNLGLENPDTPA